MPFLGYDPDRVPGLHRAMLDASDELDALRTVEPEAADAMRALRACRTAIDSAWEPVVRQLLSCPLLTEAQPVVLDQHDLRAAVLGGSHAGWELVDDPMGAAAGPHQLVDEARALATALLDPERTDELSPGELQWLARELAAISERPFALAALRAGLGGEAGWARLVGRLGADRLAQQQRLAEDSHDSEAHDRIALLDDTLDSVVEAYAGGPHTSHAPWYPAILDDIDPYSGALLLSRLDPAALNAAAAASALVTQWLAGWQDGAIPPDQLTGGDNAVDIVFDWLAQSPAAARQFLSRAADDPEMVLATGHDASVRRLLLAGTAPDPEHPAHDAQVGRIVPPLIDWAARHSEPKWGPVSHGVDDPEVIFAEVLAPWLMQVTARSDEWAWRPGEADAALRWVIHDGAAAERLVSKMDALQASLATTPLVDAGGKVRFEALQDAATLFAAMQLAFRDEEISDAVDAQFWKKAVTFIGQTAINAVPEGRSASVTIGAGIGVVSPQAQKWIDGLLRGPEQPEADAERRFEQRTADLQAVAVGAVVAQLITDGALPPDTLDRLDLEGTQDAECVADAVNQRVRDFIVSLRDETDAATFDAIVAVNDTFANPLSVAQAC